MQFLYTKNSIYKPRYFLYNYNGNDFRFVKIKNCRLPDFENVKPTLHTDFIDYNSLEVQRCSLSRTKRNVREIALCNNFKYFATLTINCLNADRFSLDEVQLKLKKILKRIKRNNPDFKYIFITEKHKDGAFHFHGLTTDFNDLYINKYGYKCSYILDNFLGYNSFSEIRDYSKCCNYITKYITKECIKNSHNQIYISSKGLKKATREEFTYLDFIPTFTNDFCEIKDFRLNDLDTLEKLELIKKLKKEN